MRPGEAPDEPPMLGHRERMHVVREHAAGGLSQRLIWANRDRKAGHDLGHREPLQQVMQFVGGEAGGWRGQHPPQVALALAGSLLESLDETVDAAAEEEWNNEIARRIRDLDAGKVKPISWAEARRQISATLKNAR